MHEVNTILNNYICYAPEYSFIFIVLLMLSVYMKSNKLAVIACIFFLCLLYFFQGANIVAKQNDKNILYCPCDGTVSAIIPHKEYIQICVFLNVHNTHVQYAPFDCTVKSIKHIPGSFHPAYLLEKSQYNERTEYVLHNKVFGDVPFVQIAGQLARSIVTFVEESNTVSTMEPIGLIKLGSRCDIYVPHGLTILVKEGDRVRIGDPLVEK